ncbi:MAG: OmpA family protein [Planctomycetota bacterium]
MGRMRSLWVLLLLAACCVGCVSQKKYNTLASENQSLRDQYQVARDESSRLSADNDSLRAQLAEAQSAPPPPPPPQPIPGAEVGSREGLTVITVSDEILFAPGKADISTNGKSVLRKVSDLLKTKYTDGAIRVEGHTDNQPIRKTKDLYKSNWELSVARALAVMHFLIDEGGIDPKRIHPAGYGEYHPVDSNAGAKGRARNRRVEIVILKGLSR